MKHYITLVLTLLFYITGYSQTADAFTIIGADEVPDNVIESLDKMNVSDSDPEWAYDNKLYEARFEADNSKLYYRFNDNGQFMERRVKKDWKKYASQSLKEAKMKTYYKNWDVIEYYEVENASNRFYVVQLKDEKGKLKTMYFDENGELEGKSNTGY